MARDEEHGRGPGRDRPKARDLNELIRYTMWSVFRVTGTLETASAQASSGRAGLAAEVEELGQHAAGKGVVTRG